ncbi:Histone-lysine N-methyltransferase EZH2 [Dirofilaria immitis]|nr:Histone-lysine N-methyltransferase EZH2 [Dirofilaria immitis]
MVTNIQMAMAMVVAEILRKDSDQRGMKDGEGVLHNNRNMDTPNSSRSIGKRGIKNDGQVGNEDSHEEKPFKGWKEDEDIPLPKYLCDDVARIYEDVMNRYRNMIDAEGLKLYHKMLREEPRKKYATSSKVKPLNLKSMPEQPTYFTLRSAMNAVLQKCPSKCIEAVMSTPRMQYWTLTECNILCEDERTLSHIPFLGDHEDEDIGFGEELLKTFQEGIHGTKVGCGSFINDHILYQVLKKLFDKYSDIDLKRRFGASDLFTEDSDQSEFLDTKTLHSFQLLLCNRCLTYDCLIHGVNATEMEVRRRRGVTSVESCGPQCFRHLTKEMEEAKRRCVSPPDAKTINAILNIKTEDISWTPQQEAMFIALRRTYKNDFCKLAEVLNLVVESAPPKSCRELYAYSFRTAPISPRADVSPNSPPKRRNQHRTFRAVKWAKTEGKVGNTHVYEPCSHSGPCSVENNCSCVSVDNLCTKFCRCGEQCKYRFPGCRCAPGLCRTKQCQCFYANWECDPDVCKSCKCDILDDPNVATCKNVAMQRGLQKKLVIAPSQVAGWGCFAEEDIEKNDFISEYCGEVISHDESERRGKIYDKLKCSYLFGLNDEMVVDATRKGNVIRFANHSKDPNCMAKVFMVNGDHRIGIFARRPIVAGEELFLIIHIILTNRLNLEVKFVSKERPKP